MTAQQELQQRLADGKPLITVYPSTKTHPDVNLLRRVLHERGHGEINPTLSTNSTLVTAAVEEEQIVEHLESDGICGHRTWFAFGQPKGIEPGTPLHDKLPAEFVAVAKTQIGVHDDRANGRKYRSPKSAHGKGVDEYLIHGGFINKGEPQGVMFCALGLQWCIDQAAARLGLPRPKFRISPSVPQLAAQAKAAGRIIAASAAGPGTVVYFTHDDGHPYHVEVCTGPVAAGHVPTIGFNTSDVSTGDGGHVAARLRGVGNAHFVDVCRA